jgi:hypothetical protein
MKRTLLTYFGIALIVINLTLAVAAVGNLVSGKAASNVGGTIGALILFVGCAVCGYMMPRAGRRSSSGPEPPHSDFEREQAILALADSNDGRLTVAEVAAHCHLGLAVSKKSLDRLVVDRVADVRVADNGTLVYVFPGFLSDAEKRAAEEI